MFQNLNTTLLQSQLHLKALPRLTNYFDPSQEEVPRLVSGNILKGILRHDLAETTSHGDFRLKPVLGKGSKVLGCRKAYIMRSTNRFIEGGWTNRLLHGRSDS